MGMGCRLLKSLGLMVIVVVSFIASGCATGYQVLRYESMITSAENIIPGIEPEESAQKIMILVRGKGVEPADGTPIQKKFLAERAAVLDGYRKLSERLAGFLINSQANSGKNLISSDEIMIETRAYMRGAQVGRVTYETGFATVDVKLYIQPRKNMFYTNRLVY